MNSFTDIVTWISANVWWLLAAGFVGLMLFAMVADRAAWIGATIAIPSAILFYGASGILLTKGAKYLGQQIVSLSSEGKILGAGAAPYIVSIGMVMAVILYNIRSKYLAMYGAMEILIGMVTLGISTASGSSEMSARSIAIVGGVYVIVRGLDNIEKGLSDKAQERWKQLLLFNFRPLVRDIRSEIEAKASPL